MMWEYKVAETDLHGGCIAELLKSYNEFELVSVIPNGTKVLLIFKRRWYDIISKEDLQKGE